MSKVDIWVVVLSVAMLAATSVIAVEALSADYDEYIQYGECTRQYNGIDVKYIHLIDGECVIEKSK